ncbi:MAG TPA: hypothetical protein PKE64_29870 [Anaerolineae bacterium]|nr:hypothetical protein [Anaerolineae bacterium]
MVNQRLTFHVPSEGAPEKMLPVLKAIYEEGQRFQSVKDLQSFSRDRGLSDRVELQGMAHAIGLLARNNDYISLTRQAETIVRLSLNLQADVIHYLLYTGWRLDTPAQNSFLWSYREVVNSYWDRRVVDVVKTANLIAEEINNRTTSLFSEVEGYSSGEVSFSPKSIRGVRKWLEALIPPVIESNVFTRRSFCPSELVLLAVGWVAQQTEGEIGIDFLITPPRREAICRLCLLEPNSLDSVLDWMLPNYPKVVLPGTSAGVYGRYLRFLRWPQIIDLIE